MIDWLIDSLIGVLQNADGSLTAAYQVQPVPTAGFATEALPADAPFPSGYPDLFSLPQTMHHVCFGPREHAVGLCPP